jgi:predicted dithiol-disulfide oxidoreductase (DUF899 family)
MEDHVLVSREDWTAARLEVLAEEKALTRHADALAAKRRAMPWDFNRDFHVSFAQAEISAGAAYYNFQKTPYFAEMQGLSVFAKLADGRIAYTYSTYARGIDVFNGAYQILDLTPKGRAEGDAVDPMFWLKRHDQYTD